MRANTLAIFYLGGRISEKVKWFIGAMCLLAAAYSLIGIRANAATPRVPPAPQSADFEAQMVQYHSGSLNISAYIAKPKIKGKYPAVIVVHSVRGLDDKT